MAKNELYVCRGVLQLGLDRGAFRFGALQAGELLKLMGSMSRRETLNYRNELMLSQWRYLLTKAPVQD